MSVDVREPNASTEDENELLERRQNEIELILAAYTPEEVWVSTHRTESRAAVASRPVPKGDCPTLVRRILIQQQSNDAIQREAAAIALDLRISMPPHYPSKESLCVESLTMADERWGDKPSARRLLKSVYNAIPELIQHCRSIADACRGEEAVWAVFAAVDDWLTTNRHRFAVVDDTSEGGNGRDERSELSSAMAKSSVAASATVTLGRRLIYSHHIISKVKRADLASLFREFQLTGFVKVGWPGLILIEGNEESCQAFYETIKRWSWQYLVVRGEMQEQVSVDESGQFAWLLPPYVEVDDFSIISQHCQSVGLEALFRTLMRVYEAPATTALEGEEATAEVRMYGAFIRVDHMNDGRAYRKWLRKTCQQLNVRIMIKECYGGTRDGNGATAVVSTRIVVVLVGDEPSVRALLKKWRTSRVDVDSKGKPCLERMMVVLHEKSIDSERSKGFQRLDWDLLCSETSLTMPMDEASDVMASIGGSTWVELLSTLFPNCHES